MGVEYALVHIKYTIPPAICLTLLYRPLLTKLDAYKIGFLIIIAVVSTIPWDSYLIRNRIWSYPSHVIIGPKMFDIPLEEVFFFVVQTYNTSLLYLILSKSTFQPIYLRVERPCSHRLGPANPQWRYYKLFGQLALLALIILSWGMVKGNGIGTYTGLILIWAVPFLLILWSLAYQFILGLPISNTAIPIILPTLYLWIVDTLALQRGTWVINTGTKFGIHLWDGLEIEEALFFLVTNTLIVFGQLAFDNALSVLYTFPGLFRDPPALPSPLLLVQALLIPAARYEQARIVGLREAVARLKKKSRSFYLASSTFQVQIRTDLLLLYSFCRVADDLVDNACSSSEANQRIEKLQQFLNTAYGDQKSGPPNLNSILNDFPPDTHSALLQLPIRKLSRQSLEDLLRGFQTDLLFSKKNTNPPIENSCDLELYACRVAGTVAQMCIELIFHSYPSSMAPEGQCRILEAGNRMGIALQYVNISRDIGVDAKMGRVYLPTTWLAQENLTFNSILRNPRGKKVEKLRSRLLDRAFTLYQSSRDAIEELPIEATGPIRVAVQSYMEIGHVLRQEGYAVKAGRATVPKGRRLMVAWMALAGRE
ncbi:Lycopene beta-cyclase [Melanomma pulvis-pyrius CBS 109.77]|uniref:Bifunctional lycopene cyclase/phytoene synthase n=1 Tax=Melanomma pulvis-pyrius CBS 109.77 TaxID=1314802 RepID=A0A6A6XRW9_9PLEO|nr:Lycopene beta-cyclase [Melanomma pulvis-pyrius CBS 109.77]